MNMKNFYNIAGLPIVMDFDPGPAFENFKVSAVNDGEQRNRPLVFTVNEAEQRNRPPVFFTVNEAEQRNRPPVFSPVFSVEQEQFRVHCYPDGFLYESRQECGAKVYCDKEYYECAVSEGPGSEHLIRLVIESRLIHEGKISLHSSCIDSPDGAFCLTGVSGVGKSTRAAAFCELDGFEMISGDRPLIDCICPTAYGVPWDGKEGLYISKAVPLRGIFSVRRLDQAGDPCSRPRESLRLFSEKAAYQKLIAQTFLPMWDTDTAAMAMGNLKRLVSGLNVYELTSGPDTASAQKCLEIMRKEVFNEN